MFATDDVLQHLADLPPDEAGPFARTADFAAALPAGAGGIISQAAAALGWTFRQVLAWLMQHPAAALALATDLLAGNWAKALADLVELLRGQPAPAP